MYVVGIVRESSHISFFCGGDSLCVLEQRPENRHDMFAWVTSGSLLSFEKLVDLFPFAWATIESMPSVQNYRPNIVFSCPMRKYEHPLCLTYWLVIGIYIIPFFPVNFLSYLRTKIYVTQSICNKSYSRQHPQSGLTGETKIKDDFYFCLSGETTLLMLSCDRIESAKFIVAS